MAQQEPESVIQTVIECALAFGGAVIILYLPIGFVVHAILRDVGLTLIIVLPLLVIAGTLAAAIRPLRKSIAGAVIF